MISTTPNAFDNTLPAAMYRSPTLPLMDRDTVDMGMTGIPWPSPNEKNSRPPASTVVSCVNMRIATGSTNAMAQGAQAIAKKTPRRKPPKTTDLFMIDLITLTNLSV